MANDTYLTIDPGQRGGLEPTFFFMMNCLMYSRLETGKPSNNDFYDEDVNVYLASLLSSFMNPAYHERARKYLSRYDTNLFHKVQDSNDARLKYTIYKTNADFLLISIGIFRNPDQTRPGARNSLLKDNEEVYMGRAKAYYQFAYSYSQSMFRHSTAVSEVLEKLSRGFEKYVQILSHMRGEYFNILDRLGSGEVYHLERSVDKMSESAKLKTLQNEFLDVYSKWMKSESRDENLRKQLRDVVRRIQQIDETFRFRMDAE